MIKSVADLDATIVRHLHRIPRDVDAVVGVPRSGVLAASLIALHLQKPLGEFGSERTWTGGRNMTPVRTRVLLVDDTVLNGRSMRWAVDRLLNVDPGLELTRLAVWSAPKTPTDAVDVALEELAQPRAFAWNLWNFDRVLATACVDFDGVLCRDPSKADNDDGPAYARFLQTTPPRFLPRHPIGWIVTCRLEQYRALTEAWLAMHGVRYGGLFMWGLPDGATRRAQGGHAEFKAAHYRTLPAELFIESDPRQAAQIREASGKPVWCTSTQAMP